MTDYKTDPAWNLDMARKNATRCAGYLKRAILGDYDDAMDSGDEPDVLEAAQNLERMIMELIEELGEERDE